MKQIYIVVTSFWPFLSIWTKCYSKVKKNVKYNKFVNYQLPNPVPVQMFHSKSHSMTLLKRTSDYYITTYIMLRFVADVAQFFPCCTPKKPCLALFSFPLRNMQSGLFALSCLWSKKKVWIRFSKKLDIV